MTFKKRTTHVEEFSPRCKSDTEGLNEEVPGIKEKEKVEQDRKHQKLTDRKLIVCTCWPKSINNSMVSEFTNN